MRHSQNALLVRKMRNKVPAYDMPLGRVKLLDLTIFSGLLKLVTDHKIQLPRCEGVYFTLSRRSSTHVPHLRDIDCHPWTNREVCFPRPGTFVS